jgi:hypothetical protein
MRVCSLIAILFASATLSATTIRADDLGPDGYFPMLSPNYVGAYTLRACIVDKVCPVRAQALFPCGTSEESAATRICTITKDGKKTVSPYRIVHQGEKEGGNCGSWFLVTCFDQIDAPPPPEPR